MIELVMAVCLVGQPERCRNVSLQFAEVTLMQCQMSGQMPAAQWLGEHPNWRLKAYKCQVAGQFANL